MARFRGRTLVLSDLRVRHHGWGSRVSIIRLEQIGGVGYFRRRAFIPGLFAFPAAVFVAAVYVAATVWDDLIVLGLIATGLTSLIPLLFRRPAIVVTAPGHKIRIGVPRRLRDEAQVFLRRIEAARHAARAHDAGLMPGPTPTSVPFGVSFRGASSRTDGGASAQ